MERRVPRSSVTPRLFALRRDRANYWCTRCFRESALLPGAAGTGTSILLPAMTMAALGEPERTGRSNPRRALHFQRIRSFAVCGLFSGQDFDKILQAQPKNVIPGRWRVEVRPTRLRKRISFFTFLKSEIAERRARGRCNYSMALIFRGQRMSADRWCCSVRGIRRSMPAKYCCPTCLANH